MTDKLYVGYARRPDFYNPMPGFVYDNGRIIVAETRASAVKKLIDYLENKNNIRGWQIPKGKIKLMTAAKDVPLEKRIKILEQVIGSKSIR